MKNKSSGDVKRPRNKRASSIYEYKPAIGASPAGNSYLNDSATNNNRSLRESYDGDLSMMNMLDEKKIGSKKRPMKKVNDDQTSVVLDPVFDDA